MNFALSRKLIVFGLVLPLAVIIGFTLATPQEAKTFLLMAAVTGLLLLPVMLKWYHPLLIFSWNAWVNVYFLPGRPQLWMLLSVMAFGIAVLNGALDRKKGFFHVPAVTWPLVLFLTVVLFTAQATGGVGVRALGAQTFGGKGYFSILFAVMGYFALSSQMLPVGSAKNYLSAYFLSGLTGVFSNLAYTLGPAFYFLFYLFPVEFAMNQALADFDMFVGMRRFTGVATAGAALYFFMMVRYGIRGIFDLRHWWRLPCFAGIVFISLLGGFRSLLLGYIVHFAVQFYFERLVRTRLCLFLVAGGLVVGASVFPFVDKLPLSVQRCMAFVPGLKVSAVARLDAEASTRWRVEMWELVIHEIPRYLIVGKGYALDPRQLYLANQAMRLGLARDNENALVSGSYHNGPLSVIIPFGLFGSIAFAWFLAAGIWVLYRNYRYGDPEMQLINTFLLAYFLGRTVVFFTIFGAVDSELYRFTGVLGLSVSLNRGVRKAQPELPETSPQLVPQPA